MEDTIWQHKYCGLAVCNPILLHAPAVRWQGRRKKEFLNTRTYATQLRQKKRADDVGVVALWWASTGECHQLSTNTATRIGSMPHKREVDG